MSPRTLDSNLRAAAARCPEQIAVVTAERSLSYAELDLAAERIATGLREQGVRPGDRVALVLPNVAEMPQAIYGVLRARAAFTPLNPTIKEDKLAGVLVRSGAAVVICDAERAPMVEAAAARAGEPVVISDPASLGHAPGAPDAGPLDVDLAAVLYTLGSTGEPKGVTVTHRNMAFVAESIIEYLEMGSEDRILCVLPLSFGYGLYQLLTCVRSAATLVLETGFTFPGRVVQALEDERITGLPGVPTVFQVLISLRGLADRELPHLRFLTNAGAGLPAATLAARRHCADRLEVHMVPRQIVLHAALPRTANGKIDRRALVEL